MVAHTYGINQLFRFVDGIRSHRKSRHFFRKRLILLHTCATCSELPSYISTMGKLGYLLVHTTSIDLGGARSRGVLRGGKGGGGSN